MKVVYENSIAGFDALGEKGKRSEDVAKEVVEDFKSFHSTGAVVDENMADQLMIFLAIAGGKIVVPEITSHIETNLSVLEKFGRGLEVEEDRNVVLRR
ncbi:MAG: RNA 3'-terminal phosphate cyclase [Candidatus Nanohaloarchaea archaeon]